MRERLPRRPFPVSWLRLASRLVGLLATGAFSGARRRLIRKLDALLSREINEIVFYEDLEAEAFADLMDVSLPRYTPVYELAIVCALAARHAGEKSLLEIGTNEGRSTRNLSAALPDWRIETVDLPAEMGRTVDDWQASELLPAAEVGRLCRDCPNVTMHLGHPAEVLAGRRFGAAFIDGDHSYEGVRRDTELAMGLVDGVVLWHDWRPEDARIGVVRYLDELKAGGVPVHVAPRTSVAWAVCRRSDHGGRGVLLRGSASPRR